MNISMIDIAKKLGVSQSTVSLALNNSPKVSAATREKVRAAAMELGYQANPYVSALMQARRHGKNPKAPPLIALITATETPDEWKERYNTGQFVKGCTTAAGSLGVRIEHFWIGEKTMTAKRLNEILFSRGIRGAILLPTGPWREKMNHLWHDIATVSYGIYEITPSTHWVTGDYYGNMEKTLNILNRNFFGKIGFVMDTPYPYKNHNRWLSAYLMEQYNRTTKPPLPAWVDPDPSFEGFKTWFLKAEPEVIISVRSSKVVGWLEQMDLKVPDDISVVTVGTAEVGGQISGIIENAITCGKLAVEMLLERIHHNEFDSYASPHHLTVGGHWNRGKTLRYQKR